MPFRIEISDGVAAYDIQFIYLGRIMTQHMNMAGDTVQPIIPFCAQCRSEEVHWEARQGAHCQAITLPP